MRSILTFITLLLLLLVAPARGHLNCQHFAVQRVSLSNPKIAEEFLEKLNPINGGTVVVITPNAAGRGAAEAIVKAYGKIR
jgi:hypothetical protein